MKATRLHEDATETTWAIILDKGEEAVGTLTKFAREQGITAAHFTAIGAFSRATIGYFDRARKDYKRIPVTSQVEVLSLIGDVALDGREPKLHAHVVLGTDDGTARGGHLMEGHVWPTLEVVLTESPEHLRRKMDPEVGLALIDLEKTRV
jgi:predicted DNA-binding protein with PD1-like motif